VCQDCVEPRSASGRNSGIWHAPHASSLRTLTCGVRSPQQDLQQVKTGGPGRRETSPGVPVTALKKSSPAFGPFFQKPLVRFAFLGCGDRFTTRADSFGGLPTYSETYSERASPAEAGDQIAFAQILLTRHFRPDSGLAPPWSFLAFSRKATSDTVVLGGRVRRSIA
jgi:hypothetical protein